MRTYRGLYIAMAGGILALAVLGARLDEQNQAVVPGVAGLLAEVNTQRQWRDIYFDCALIEKHLGKSDRIDYYVEQFEAYGVPAYKNMTNGRHWVRFEFDRSILRQVPHSHFWRGDIFTVLFEVKNDGPDAMIEDCKATLWAAFPYI